MLCGLDTSERMEMKASASSFYRHKEGRSTCTGNLRSRHLLPESVVCSGQLLWNVHCGELESTAPGMAVDLGSSLALRGLRWCSGDSCRRCGVLCTKYRPPCLSWRSAEGPIDGGLALVKVRTPSGGPPHACRGFCSRGRYRELAA